jgi:hypothetical protein
MKDFYIFDIVKKIIYKKALREMQGLAIGPKNDFSAMSDQSDTQEHFTPCPP